MRRGRTDAETCRLNSWKVGDALEGDEGYGTDAIVLTAIGNEHILAAHKGYEGLWTLDYREWRRVP